MMAIDVLVAALYTVVKLSSTKYSETADYLAHQSFSRSEAEPDLP